MFQAAPAKNDFYFLLFGFLLAACSRLSGAAGFTGRCSRTGAGFSGLGRFASAAGLAGSCRSTAAGRLFGHCCFVSHRCGSADESVGGFIILDIDELKIALGICLFADIGDRTVFVGTLFNRWISSSSLGGFVCAAGFTGGCRSTVT